mgnify:CR=1 FL=1
MKKIIALAIPFLVGAAAQAADTLDGCGLGWQVTQGKTYTATATRLTTNMFVPPTFGMTTGTIGCDKLDVGQNEQESLNYVASNFESLKTELAMGEGEYVDGLANTMSCSADLATKVQSNYDQVVAPATDAFELYTNIKTVCI